MFKLYFITSNRTKLAHARYCATDYDVLIVPKINYGIGYIEPRIYDRDQLLEESFHDAKNRWFKSVSSPDDKMFFIEDTSVIIHALSKEREVPGVDIKYWMKDNNFLTVDQMLRLLGNDRTVTVRSDILLYLASRLREPGGKEYKRFTNESYGRVTEREYIFKTNPLYPWLDNKSFNKWFVPNGCSVPISKLSIIEANRHDFRGPAFTEMFEYLRAKRLINIRRPVVNRIIRQTELPVFQIPILIISGLPCSGKTTIGHYLAKKCGYYHIEASDFMYLSYYETHGIGSSVEIGDFAAQALKKTPNIVVDQIIQNIKKSGDVPIIITGFRSPKEIDLFISHYNGTFQVEVSYITATESKRYDRCMKRSRADKTKSKDAFRARDVQQLGMGLVEIEKKYRKNSIVNNTNVRTFIRSFLAKYGLESLRRKMVSPRVDMSKHRPMGLEDAIIIAMFNDKKDRGSYLTTTEIAHLINSFFDKSSFQTSKNNVSRYFNQNFHPHYDISLDIAVGKRKYRLSQTGISRGLLLLNKVSFQSIRRRILGIGKIRQVTLSLLLLDTEDQANNQ